MGRIVETVTEEREVTKLKDIICDVCDKTTTVIISTDGEHFNHCYAKIEASWPYGSPKDTEAHEAYLCESCYDNIVETFKIKVRKGEYMIYDPNTVHWHDD